MAPSPQRILVVEDDPDLVDLLTTVLGEEGYVARGAGNGAEALAVVDEWPPRPHFP
jgi:CheY-like chemotaxis protein